MGGGLGSRRPAWGKKGESETRTQDVTRHGVIGTPWPMTNVMGQKVPMTPMTGVTRHGCQGRHGCHGYPLDHDKRHGSKAPHDTMTCDTLNSTESLKATNFHKPKQIGRRNNNNHNQIIIISSSLVPTKKKKETGLYKC